MEYLWLAGVSRVGKATLARALQEDAEQRELLGVRGPVSIVGASEAGTPQRFDIEKLEAPYAVKTLVIKWQFANARRGDVRTLMRRFPLATHRILVLEAEPEEVLRRWQESSRAYLRTTSDEARRQQLDDETRELEMHLFATPPPPGLTINRVSRDGTHFVMRDGESSSLV